MKYRVGVVRVLPWEGQEQIVHVFIVIPPRRPPERMMEQVGGFLPHQIVQEIGNVVRQGALF